MTRRSSARSLSAFSLPPLHSLRMQTFSTDVGLLLLYSTLGIGARRRNRAIDVLMNRTQTVNLMYVSLEHIKKGTVCGL